MTVPEKTIIRTVKNADNPFVMIDRRPIENPDLSWKAKGVLAYLLSRPDNWVVRLTDLVNRSTDGEHAVRAAISELTNAGHIKRKIERTEGGKFVQFVLEVHEVPVPMGVRKPVGENQEMDKEPFGDFPQVGNPQVDNPQVGNRAVNNINLNKNDSTDMCVEQKKKKMHTKVEKINDGQEIPNFYTMTMVEAKRIPEIAVYINVTQLWPGTDRLPLIYQIIHNNQFTEQDLAPFWKEWAFRGYNTRSLNWIEWAVDGKIPPRPDRSTSKQKRGPANPERYVVTDAQKTEFQKQIKGGLT